ncbi:glyoxylate/hydroxypyruvate reductase A [Ancylomarina euxinus]|uniref:Glyoxylate/hydroxypyruvate reductase A n=1 Tax=Ancylomarina euxinus TaxID=2283627 RepID=A0A425XZC3_9BACT|nr:glyoxylate/hydroxypyruvate reductase A [Ancylomarina euxinus]MCZ4695585.1 glyoxylate/hydroxypyruvate reductase A [Ancylomarina euxinus]MUP15966.1 glyoxylate/hydroxypyruvate reductase A [Ancylomarina euxinus]RRG20408.1 glyoxylate/hydroxypyruvate reductase A [Ancylomarina euxinus]
MSILLVFENKDVNPWYETLKAKLPDTNIEIYPEVKNKSSVDFVICWKPKKNVLKEFGNVKVIQSVGASIDHITNSQHLSKDHLVTRIVDENLSNDMWEFLVTIVLSQLKNVKNYHKYQKAKVWEQLEYRSIHKTTVAILGLGSIGGYVAYKFAQFGFKLKGWSYSKKQISNVESFTGDDGLDACLSNSDFLINLLPLTENTKNILNKKTLQKLPQHSFVINVGRGEHLVESDLIELINCSKLSGALLDVFRTEPLPIEHPFWNHPKIQITPHIASLTNIESAIGQIVENYRRFKNNEELLHAVSIEKGY